MNRLSISRIYRLGVLTALFVALLAIRWYVPPAEAAALCPGITCGGPLFSMTPTETTVQALEGQTVTVAIKLHNFAPTDRIIWLGAGGSLNWPAKLSSTMPHNTGNTPSVSPLTTLNSAKKWLRPIAGTIAIASR